MFTPGPCDPRRPKPEFQTEIVEHPYKTLYTPASNLAQRRAKRASSVLLIRLYGRGTAGSTPIKGANVDKRAGTRAMARSTIDSPFRPVEAQETNLSFSPIGPGMYRPLPIVHCPLRSNGYGESTRRPISSHLLPPSAFVLAVGAELNWTYLYLRRGFAWWAFLPQR